MKGIEHTPEIQGLIDQVVLYQFTDFAKVTSACEELLKLSAAMKDTHAEAYAYYYLAEMLFNKNQFPETISFTFKGLYLQQQNNYYSLEINSYNLLGNVFRIQQNEQLALDFYFKGLNRSIETNKTLQEAVTSSNIASIYYNLEDYKTAASYFKKCIQYYEMEAPAKDTTIDYTCPLAASCINLGLTSFRLEDIEQLALCINKLKTLNYSKFSITFKQLLSFLNAAYEYSLHNIDTCLLYVNDFITFFGKGTNIMETFQEYLDNFHFAMSFNALEEATALFEIIQKIANDSKDPDTLIKYYDIQIQYYDWTNNKIELDTAYKNYYKIKKQYGSTIKSERLNALNLQFSLNSILEEQKKNAKNIESLKLKSEHDALTSLPNRYLLREYCEEQFSFTMEQGYNFGVALLDMDSFKEYNDFWGHLEGDTCITKVSTLIKKLSTSYFCARYGGDEFILIFVNKRSSEIQDMIDELSNELRMLRIKHAPSISSPYMTLSYGLVNAIPQKDADYHDFIHKADIELYKNKTKKKETIFTTIHSFSNIT